ncbi:Qat anti-phage system TatD family nuclease QatD [Eubacterium sp. An3]|uniref:Qat anti-phage system TatD family nuclease QatD n=1 Tax=Eubacterium sp. An3 TaxID=1965628 RepID=UPI000B370BD1|nr:Qat anti-phage system TatD family nuclease QatD [Eubacterium sp. An3]OUO27037.1 hypothetical protein B5F87_11925 [Eubacterium sp. An3]
MICDAHCHLDLMNNMLGFINEVKNSDMSLFAVGTTPRAYKREVQFCKNTQNIYVGLGMHPQLVSSGYDDIQVFKEFFEQNHYIGEIGLDFSKGYIRTKEAQIEIFSEIIRLCEQYGEKVISIHSLKSANAVIEILKTYKRQNSNKYIFHWFTGSMSQLEKAIELGCYFSINPRMLKTKSGIEVIKTVPIDRVLLETDAPFAFKSQHVNDIEKELQKTLLKISDIVGFDISDIIYKNFRNIFCY